MISVDHLEPAPPMDVFGRSCPHPGEIHPELHNRGIIDENHKTRWYLVDYSSLEPEYHKWHTLKELGEDMADLLADYRLRRPATTV